ncbi:hypothetical protein [Ferroglobus sp.]|uniref:hypothetical protein n=1 Tax=Ferroglobus sp. TaxID=2614230 RepID=UPI0025C47D5A|nr:hypothetical protein [Ferroglobus sp.]
MPEFQRRRLMDALLIYAMVFLAILVIDSSNFSAEAKIIIGLAVAGFFLLLEFRVVRRMSDTEKNIFGLVTTSVLAATSIYNDIRKGWISFFSYFFAALVVFGIAWTMYSARQVKRCG